MAGRPQRAERAGIMTAKSMVKMEGVRVTETNTSYYVDSPVTGYIAIPKNRGWVFNGDYVEPTFSPSMNETWGREGQTRIDLAADPHPNRNHCFIRAGHIEYLSDCTHSMAGQTVRIRPCDAYYPDGYTPGAEFDGHPTCVFTDDDLLSA